MIELILGYIIEAMLYLFSMTIYVFVVGSVLPRYLLKLRYLIGEPTDRGLRKYVFPGGRGVSYEPHPNIRKYVTLYVLFAKDGVKYIRLKAREDISRISYAAVVFDSENRVVDVVKVSDTPGESGYTRSVMLPKEASYVSLLVYSVDGKRLIKTQQFAYSENKKRLFILSVVACTVAEAFVLRSFALKILEYVGEYVKLAPMEISVFATIVASTLIGLSGALITISKNRKREVGKI